MAAYPTQENIEKGEEWISSHGYEELFEKIKILDEWFDPNKGFPFDSFHIYTYPAMTYGYPEIEIMSKSPTDMDDLTSLYNLVGAKGCGGVSDYLFALILYWQQDERLYLNFPHLNMRPTSPTPGDIDIDDHDDIYENTEEDRG
jgi:hypothetical protein